MFAKILIANRGEIACRIISTARRLGVRTVAVYSDADLDARHVAMADEAVHIGPALAAESYLRGDRIIEAARATGAEAIHPGYGFLSENPEFVDDVVKAGLVFIGPTADAIRAMGLKDAAKDLMEKAGVPIVPGYHGSNQDPQALAQEAAKIGYPVLIKARAGGGGKGMRLVQTPDEFADAFAGAQREGQASFGDPTCLIEKYITHPRHIEIQVFGDSQGNVVHLFERDCSLQRRHQKVIEEAPAPDMPEAVRAAMGRAAVEAASAINYQGAGTVEFIVDGSGPLREDGFWFMEMNTRLQVEHPVSEAITGLDFVELQLSIASGEALPVAQQDLSINGWAFEARVYAEDVPKGFLPATGQLKHLAFPDGCDFVIAPVRIDSGVRPGDEISPWYDPMIAKVIVHGPTRAAALNMLGAALADCHVVGAVTNLEFLGALAHHEGFAKGEVDTGLIGRDLSALTRQPEASGKVLALAALSALGLLHENGQTDPWEKLAGWRLWSDARQYIALEIAGARFEQRVRVLGQGQFEVEHDGKSVTLQAKPLGGTMYQVMQDGVLSRADIVVSQSCVSVFCQGRSHVFSLPDGLVDEDSESVGGDNIRAPMPGLVKDVFAKPGATVSLGDPLMILEAMKMEHTLTAPRDGVVADLLAQPGDQVTDGMLLLALEPHDA